MIIKNKPLLKLGSIPMVIHTYFRAKMSKYLDEVIICCDDRKIAEEFDLNYNVVRSICNYERN